MGKGKRSRASKHNADNGNTIKSLKYKQLLKEKSKLAVEKKKKRKQQVCT